MKMIKQSAYIVFSVVFILMFLLVIKDYANDKKVVAEVDDIAIKEQDIEEVLNDIFRDHAINRTVNEVLIQKEISYQGYGSLNEEELNKATRYYGLINHIEPHDLDLTQPKIKEEVELLYHTMLLIKEYTVTDEELENFWDEEKHRSLPTKYRIKVYADDDHDTLLEMENHLLTGASLQDVEEKFNISFDEKTIDDHHGMSVEISELKPGEFIHTHDYFDEEIEEDHADHEDHGDHEGHIHHDDHENHENHHNQMSHALIILEDIERDSNITIEDDKEEILDFYVTKKIAKERIELINYLKGKYKVRLING